MNDDDHADLRLTVVDVSSEFFEALLVAARQGIAAAGDDVDALAAMVRKAKVDGNLSAERRISTLASAAFYSADAARLATMLAVAIDRLVTLEDFEKSVPRETRK